MMMIMATIIIIIIIFFREVQSDRYVTLHLRKKCAAWGSLIHGIPDLSHARRTHFQQLLSL
jgi:hypothetical protein